jgi:TPR repeat protein
MFKRSVISSVVGMVLGIQCSSNAVADSTKYVLMAKADSNSPATFYTEKPKSQWGWWSKFDWQSYTKSGINKKDLRLLKLAAKFGDAQAQYVLGMLYSESENQNKSMFWLGKSAKQGHVSAKFVYDYNMNADEDFGIGC